MKCKWETEIGQEQFSVVATSSANTIKLESTSTSGECGLVGTEVRCAPGQAHVELTVISLTDYIDPTGEVVDYTAIRDVPADCCDWIARPMAVRDISPLEANQTILTARGLNDLRDYDGCPVMPMEFQVHDLGPEKLTSGRATIVLQEKCEIFLNFNGAVLRYSVSQTSGDWLVAPLIAGRGSTYTFDLRAGTLLSSADQVVLVPTFSEYYIASCPTLPHAVSDASTTVHFTQGLNTLGLPLGCEVHTTGTAFSVLVFQRWGEVKYNESTVPIDPASIDPYSWVLVNDTTPVFLYYQHARRVEGLGPLASQAYEEINVDAETWIDRGVALMHRSDTQLALVGVNAVPQPCCPWFDWNQRDLCAADPHCNTNGGRCTMTALQLISLVPTVAGFLDKCQREHSTPSTPEPDRVAMFAKAQRDFTLADMEQVLVSVESMGTPIDRRGELFVRGATDWHDELNIPNVTTAGRVRKTFVINPGSKVGDTIIVNVAESADETFRTVAEEAQGSAARLRTWTVYVPGISVVDPCTGQASEPKLYLKGDGLRPANQDEVIGGESVWNITVVVEASCARQTSDKSPTNLCTASTRCGRHMT